MKSKGVRRLEGELRHQSVGTLVTSAEPRGRGALVDRSLDFSLTPAHFPWRRHTVECQTTERKLKMDTNVFVC